jgi:acyl transferase domain-containing protein
MAPEETARSGRDIAIVGMACRFAGAANINEYWSLLKDPEPQFAPVPDERWHHGSFLGDNLRDPHSAYVDRMATLPTSVTSTLVTTRSRRSGPGPWTRSTA